MAQNTMSTYCSWDRLGGPGRLSPSARGRVSKVSPSSSVMNQVNRFSSCGSSNQFTLLSIARRQPECTEVSHRPGAWGYLAGWETLN